MNIFKLVVLGCSSSLPTAKRNLSSQVVEAGGQLFLIDCGEGTQMQLRRNKIKFQRIQRIFISHLHGDHYYGLIGLLSTMNMLGRLTELHIHCPGDLEGMINTLLNTSETKLRYPVVYHQLNFVSGDLLYESNRLKVESIQLNHRVPCSGFLFREKIGTRKLKPDAIVKYNIPVIDREAIKNGGDFCSEDGVVVPNQEITLSPPAPRSYAYCSDTAYFESVVNDVADVDLLYHEATFMDSHIERAEETYHSTAKQAATIAYKANVKQLVLGHFSARYKELEPLLMEARTIFQNTELAEDGKVFEVSNQPLSIKA